MSYESVVEQVKAAPEACLDEISDIIGYVVFRYERDKEMSKDGASGVSQYFGAIKDFGDGLKLQKEWRNEWA